VDDRELVMAVLAGAPVARRPARADVLIAPVQLFIAFGWRQRNASRGTMKRLLSGRSNELFNDEFQ